MYVLKYTTIANIARRLRGRLNVVTDSNSLSNAGGGTVDKQLILQVAQQIESKLDIALGQIYKLPIPQNANVALQIIGAIAEKLIVSEIALTHFKIQVNPETGADMGFGNSLRKQAFEEAEAIFSSHGVFVPGIMSRPPNNPMIGESKQPLVLPGVQLLSSEARPDTYSRVDSINYDRTLPAEQQLWGE